MDDQRLGMVMEPVRALQVDAPLDIPTYPEGNSEIVHPSVVDAGAGGWRPR